MKCYVINLARAPERLDHIRRTFQAAGIAFERFEAIDGEAAHRHPVAPRVSPMRHRPWTTGELACFLSHVSVWTVIARGSESFGAVFEDDVHLDTRLATILERPDLLPADADVVKLETVGQKVSVSRRKHVGPSGIAFARLRSTHYGAGAYILSRTTARHLVSSLEQIDVPADDLLFGFYHPLGRQLRAYQALPALAIQDSVMAGSAGNPNLPSGLEPERAEPQRMRAARLRASPIGRAVRKLRAGGSVVGHALLCRTLVVPYVGAQGSIAR